MKLHVNHPPPPSRPSKYDFVHLYNFPLDGEIHNVCYSYRKFSYIQYINTKMHLINYKSQNKIRDKYQLLHVSAAECHLRTQKNPVAWSAGLVILRVRWLPEDTAPVSKHVAVIINMIGVSWPEMCCVLLSAYVGQYIEGKINTLTRVYFIKKNAQKWSGN
jgi:hypothetical protein